MKAGDVALTPLPQTNGRIKDRPVVILREMPPFRDLLVCAISTQLRQEVAGFDDLIQPGETDFSLSGLKAASVIRPGFLTVLPRSSFVGIIGSISHEHYLRLMQRLSDFLRPKPTA